MARDRGLSGVKADHCQAEWSGGSPRGNSSAPRNLLQPVQMELVLLRHGYTQWNKERRYLGRTDLPLLPGEAQRLADLRLQPALSGEFQQVYCSDLLRCQETLTILAPHLEQKAVYDSRMREMDFGAWEGCTYEQLQDNGHYRNWIDHPESVTPPEGESWEDFTGRVEAVWGQLQREAGLGIEARAETDATGSVAALPGADSASQEECVQGRDMPKTTVRELESTQAPVVYRVLLVTHGGVIRQLLARFVEGLTFYTAAAPAPGEVTVLNLKSDTGTWSRIAREVQ